MNQPSEIAEDYIALWNEPDEAKRRGRIERSWAEDARYVDPLMRGNGHDGIARMIAAARASFPGHWFKLRGEPDGHADYVRFSWSLAPERGDAPVGGGTDVVRLDPEGRIAEVIGFLDGAPA